MKKCTIKIIKNGSMLRENIEYADTIWNRIVGLMFRSNISQNEGMVITSCNSIHTCFMRFPIDVIFLNKEFKVVKIVKNIRPWRMTTPFLNAKYAIELAGNSVKENEIMIGDQLEVLSYV